MIAFSFQHESLKTPIAQKKYNRLVSHILGVGVHNKHTLTDWYDVPRQSLKNAVWDYNVYKPLLMPYIECNNEYKTGNKETGAKGECLKYRVTDKLVQSDFSFTDDVQEHTPNFEYKAQLVKIHLKALNALSIATNDKRGAIVTTAKQANYYLNRYLTESLTPDYVESRKLFIDHIKGTFLKKGNTISIRKYLFDRKEFNILSNDKDRTIQNFIQHKTKLAQIAGAYILDCIRQKNHFINCSPTNGRITHTFAAMPEILTKYLLLNGKPLKGFDLKNSQFLLLSHVFENCLPESKKSLFNYIYKNRFDTEGVGKDALKTDVRTVIDEIKSIVKDIELKPDFYKFLNASFEGKLYATIDSNKNKAKISCFAVLFGTARKTEKSELFKKQYPTVLKIVNRLKKKIGYKNISTFLQRIESIIFIETLSKELIQRKILHLTKHDSIYTTITDFAKVQSVCYRNLDVIFDAKYSFSKD